MKATAALIVLTVTLASHTHAAFYSAPQDFGNFTPNGLLTGSGWASINVVVTNDTSIGFNNDFAAYFSEEAVATNILNQTNLGAAKVWTDFRIKPAIGTRPEVVPSDVQVYFSFDEEGYIEYLDDGETWTRATHDIFGVPVVPVVTGAWQRVSIFQDYGSQTYAIILNDVVVAQDVPFVHPSSDYVSFKMTNPEKEAYLDEIRIHNSLIADLEGDGNNNSIADSVELNTYGYVARTLVVDDSFTAPAAPAFDEISSALAVWRARDTLQVNAGSYGAITISGNVTLVGDGFTVDSITVANGATLTLEEDVVVTGAFTVANGGTLVAGGTLGADDITIEGAFSVAGALDVSGTLTVSSGVAFSLAADAVVANLSVAGTIDVGTHTLTVSGTADMSGSGQILLASSGTLDADTITMASDSQIVSTGGMLENTLLTLSGTFTITASSWNASAPVAQTIPFADDFERYEVGKAMENLGIFGWSTPNSNVAVSSVAALGNRSVMLPDGTELELRISRGGAPRVWTDFYVRPSFGIGPDPLLASAGRGFVCFVDNEGNLNVVQVDGASTNWVPLSATASWDDGSVAFTNSFAGAFDTNSFTRVSVYQNYADKTFSVIINDENIVAVAMPFPDQSATYQSLHIDNTGGTSYLDDILVTPNLLSFAGSIDINNNDMDDRDEIHWYGDLETYAGVQSSVFRFR